MSHSIHRNATRGEAAANYFHLIPSSFPESSLTTSALSPQLERVLVLGECDFIIGVVSLCQPSFFSFFSFKRLEPGYQSLIPFPFRSGGTSQVHHLFMRARNTDCDYNNEHGGQPRRGEHRHAVSYSRLIVAAIWGFNVGSGATLRGRTSSG